MLVDIHLYGVMGRAFGKKWKFAVSSPSEALRMIEANKPGLLNWIRTNREVYSKYRVTCKYADGRKEALCDETYMLEREVVSISFIPIAEGSGGVLKVVIGVAMIVVGWGNPMMMFQGAMMVLGGVIEMLTPQPRLNNGGQEQNNKRESHYFDGPANTTRQGNPIPLIYGQVLAGSQVVSANLTIDQIAD